MTSSPLIILPDAPVLVTGLSDAAWLDPTGEMRRAAATRTAKNLTVAQLRIKLAELGQSTDGTKPVLVARYVARATR